ncbi:hypothetical protein CDL15_Pgr020395 [Punica granatum]|uniref:Uncharacterized protein n=1 Tax=Punica granatum TaxID=22663 RepID=A0A218VW24_PUNGR|nr:hypothetical protein CDL15_Pgr020395 [Punica granatum]
MEILTESSTISPRISFSHDLTLYDVVPVEQPHFKPDSHSALNPGFEFDLGNPQSFDHESCSVADELFSQGKILPTEIKKKTTTTSSTAPILKRGGGGGEEQVRRVTSLQFSAAGREPSMKQNPKLSGEPEKQQSSNSKSFWRFKRSSSLNCGSGYGRKLCPLPLLSRSNSTGSTEVPLTKEGHPYYQKQQQQLLPSNCSQKHPPPAPPPPPPPPPASKPLQARLSNGYNQSQRPPLRRSGVTSSYNGSTNTMRVNPALNVHSGNLFGLGSIIFNGKDKNRRK